MAAGSTYTPLATQTLGSAAATVTFSSISGAYTDLVLVANVIPTSSPYYAFRAGNGSVSTSSLYSRTALYGTGSSASSARASNETYAYAFEDVIASSPSTFITSFQNYSNTTTNKTFITRGNSASSLVGATVNLFRSTSAINVIEVNTGGVSTFAAGSTFTLYGIAAA
jgi:hypothetical protein